MLYTQRADFTCGYRCCGDFVKKRNKRKGDNFHRTLRTREKRMWRAEQF